MLIQSTGLLRAYAKAVSKYTDHQSVYACRANETTYLLPENANSEIKTTDLLPAYSRAVIRIIDMLSICASGVIKTSDLLSSYASRVIKKNTDQL